MDLESFLLDNDIEVVSQDEISIVLEINGRQIVFVAVFDEYHNPILSTRIF